MQRLLVQWKGGSMAGPVGLIRRQWMKQYEVFVRRRFNIYSRGGGDWPPLRLSTLIARQRGKAQGKTARFWGAQARHKSPARSVTTVRGRRFGVAVSGSYSILKDTGVLFSGLSLGASGNAARGVPSGIAFGFSGASHGGGASIATIARAHDTGAGRLPRRRILAKPDEATAGRMARTFSAEIIKASKASGSSITGPGV